MVAFRCNFRLCPIGGAHEGLQHLGPYGNIPNIVAELTGDSVPKDFSEDHGYPDPPNPCPLGKTGILIQVQSNAQIYSGVNREIYIIYRERIYRSVGVTIHFV